METKIIDRLFLELSQVTQATTAKEIALQGKLEDLRDDVVRALAAWDGTVLPKAHDGMMQERMESLRAALRA